EPWLTGLGELKRVGVVTISIDGVFQFNRSLSFIVDLLPDADQSGHGIKQTAATGSQRSIDLLFDHSQQKVSFVYIQLLHERNWQLQEVVSEMMEQVTDRHAPRLTNRRRAARHRDVLKVGGPLEVPVICDQHLATPNAPVRSVAGAIEREANHAFIEVVLRHTTCNVRVVVL